MTKLFHGRHYVRFTEIKSNLGWKKLHRTNQGFNFLGSSFSNKDNVRAQIKFQRERQSQHLKKNSSRTELLTFTSIAPQLLEQLHETS